MTRSLLRSLLIALALITVPSLLKAGPREDALKQAGAAYDADIARLDELISKATAAVEKKRAEITRLQKTLGGEQGTLEQAKITRDRDDEALKAAENSPVKQKDPKLMIAALRQKADNIEKANITFNEAKKNYDESAAKIAQLDAEIEKHNQEVKQIEERLRKSGGVFGSPTGLKVDKDKQVVAQGLAIKKMGASVDNLEADIKKANVSAKLKDIKSDIKDAELKYAILENTYNQGLIGDFLRMKMEGLLRDKAFCEATKACANGEKTKPDLKGLFNSTERDRAKKDKESHK